MEIINNRRIINFNDLIRLFNNNEKKDYYLKYKNFNPKVINAVKKIIFEKKIFKASYKERFNILEELLKDLCEIYKIPYEKIPKLNITNKGRGFYNLNTNKIYIDNNLSLITLLHEFKHFLQHINNKTNNEEIARGYSISLFYLCSPKHFINAVKKGLIIHQKPLKNQ